MGNIIRTRPTPGKGAFSQHARDYVYMEGDARQARVLTAPGPRDDEASWVAQPVEAVITITQEGVATVTSPYLDDASAKALASDYQRKLRDAGLVVLEQGNRYWIGWSYVAIDRIEAERLAKVANTTDIRKDEGVEVTHGTDSWALWSDGRITTSIGLPRWLCQRTSLSKDAAQLISVVAGPAAAGGPHRVRNHRAVRESWLGPLRSAPYSAAGSRADRWQPLYMVGVHHRLPGRVCLRAL